MKANAATMSRRQMLATMPAAIAMTGTAAAEASDDPVFAAVERHHKAVDAWLLEEKKEKPNARLQDAEQDAYVAWLTTPPTTVGGAIATHATTRNEPWEDGILLESAHYDGRRRTAAQQFPLMIAAALRKIRS
jgi:hypothetical protein